MAYAEVVTLKANFSKVLHYVDAALPPDVLNACEGAYNELKRFQDFMERLGSSNRKRLSAMLERVVEAIHEYRDSATGLDDNFIKPTHSLIEKLKKIRAECYSMLQDDGEAVSPSSLKITGIRDELSKLKEALVDEDVKQTVFLLAGTAGIGKTALAREVFEDLDISDSFPCRAWVTLGNEWKPEVMEVVKAIQAQLDPVVDDKWDYLYGYWEGKILCLKNSLKKERCLIVVDDVWDHRAFHREMERVLMHESDGPCTRFILTSRIKDSEFADTWYFFDKRFLNEEESWDLLREKAFVSGSCPPQLEDAGKKIAIKCDGLPLTIITIAALLSNCEKSLWIDVAKKKNMRSLLMHIIKYQRYCIPAIKIFLMV